MWRRSAPSRVVSLDLETSGLELDEARMLSVGMVPVVDDTILVGEAFTSLVRPGLSAVTARTTRSPSTGSGGLRGMEAHHLRPSDLAEAPSLRATMRAIVARLGEADALLVHHAPLDLGVLRRSCVEVGEPWPRIAVIDTLRLVQRANRRGALIGAAAIPTDLAGARAAVGLPPHGAHDPLADAIATAELYLVLRRSAGSPS